jgi:CheY-like chemotaxis protein
MAKEILIADSDKTDREEFQIIFKTSDYNIVFSENGEETLLRVKLFKPDLIILGPFFNGKSGLEIFEMLRADPESKHIPIVCLSNIFEETSEKDHERVQADGVITKPLQEDQILNLVDRLIQEEVRRSKEEGIIGREMDWKSLAVMSNVPSKKEEEVLLNEGGEAGEGEIIDLVDVVEESERKMSIHDFVAPEKEEPFQGITPLESWEKLIEEEKPADKILQFAPDEKDRETKGLPLQLNEEFISKGEAQEKELFEKIELEEILQKVEQLAPSIEKEWPPVIQQKVKEGVEKEVIEPVLPTMEEPPEKYAGLAEFESAIKIGVGTEHLKEEAQPFIVGKPKKEAPEEFIPTEVSIEKELQEVREEEFQEPLLEEPEEKGIEAIKKPKEERLEIFEEAEAPVMEEEEEEFKAVKKPKEERMEIFEEVELRGIEEEEEVKAIKKPKKERMEIFEEVEFRGIEEEEEEVKTIKKPKEERLEIFEEAEAPVMEEEEEEFKAVKKPKEERFEIFKEIEAPGIEEEEEEEEVKTIKKPKEERLEIFEEAEAPVMEEEEEEEVRGIRKLKEEGIELLEKEMATEVMDSITKEKEIARPLRVIESQMEEIISKGIREMMEEFITKLVPEMTQSIINLTIERIEQIVKEIIPELAEKMIREEIKRLQKGEKD